MQEKKFKNYWGKNKEVKFIVFEIVKRTVTKSTYSLSFERIFSMSLSYEIVDQIEIAHSRYIRYYIDTQKLLLLNNLLKIGFLSLCL